MTVASLTYAFQTAPWDSPLSLGVQAFIEYNGYVINDRHQSDRIRITSITGLDDPDSTDSREVVPGDQGEFVYDSWYRGRTIVLTGSIQAGSLGTLMRMERDLRAAYGTLEESPMKFRWFDVYDGFDDPQTLENYTFVVGSSSGIVPASGVLNWGTTSQAILMRSSDNRLYGDAQTTLRMVSGSFSADSSKLSIILKLIDANNYLEAAFTNASTPTLTINSVVGGTSHTIGTLNVPALTNGQSYWLRAKSEGDLVTCELWSTKPTVNTLPTNYVTAWLTGADSDAYGDQVLSQVGFGATMGTAAWVLDDFQISSLSPADLVFNAKKMPNGMSIKDSQDNITRFSRALQITMRTSQPFARAATQSRSLALVPTASSGTQEGFGNPLSSPLIADIIIPDTIPQSNNILSFNNRGTAPFRPLIYVYGASNPFAIVNLENNQQLTWNGELVDGDFLVIDCQNRTIVNSTGTNALAFLQPSTPYWMWLEPGWNDLFFFGSGYSANTKMLLYANGSWL